jgi:hypothetical protein
MHVGGYEALSCSTHCQRQSRSPLMSSNRHNVFGTISLSNVPAALLEGDSLACWAGQCIAVSQGVGHGRSLTCELAQLLRKSAQCSLKRRLRGDASPTEQDPGQSRARDARALDREYDAGYLQPRAT